MYDLNELINYQASSSSLTMLDVLSKKGDSPVFEMNEQDFIKTIQEVIPEVIYLNGEQNAQLEAFSNLLKLKDVICGSEASYAHFVKDYLNTSQTLSYTSFKKMGVYIREILQTPEDYAIAIWLIICKNLGQSTATMARNHLSPEHDVLPSSQLFAVLLRQCPQFFPAFNRFSQEHRKQILLCVTTEKLHDIKDLLLPEVSLVSLINFDKRALQLYVLQSLFISSLQINNETWNYYQTFRGSFEKLNHSGEHSFERVYAHYLAFRGRAIGITSLSSENIALIRLAGILRWNCPNQGQLLSEVFNTLPAEKKTILTNEFNVHGGFQLRAIFLEGGASLLLNPQVALHRMPANGGRVNQNREGLEIGLSTMASILGHARRRVGLGASVREVFVAECGQVAQALLHNPKALLAMDIKPAIACERRMGFSLTPRLSTTPAFFTMPQKIPYVGLLIGGAAVISAGFFASKHFNAEPTICNDEQLKVTKGN